MRGLRETVRAFNRLDRKLTRELQNELKKAAEPVAETARSKISRYQGASVGTIRVHARGASVVVRQNANKVSGLRGDFGSLQMKKGFLPALAEHQDEIIDSVEDALDRWSAVEGF